MSKSLVPVRLIPCKEAHSRHRYEMKEWVLPSVWAMKARLIKGAPMIFYAKKGINPRFHRPWLVAPMDDMGKTIVIQKARQMGVTEAMITKGLHIATLIRTRTVYTLPKEGKAREIAATRIHPMGVRNHPDGLQDWARVQCIGRWQSIMSKMLIPLYGGGASELFVTGSFNEELGESTAADQVFLDEFDRMRPGVISAFRQSLRSSRLAFLRVYSTPTFPKVGVNAMFNTSDKKVWMYKCSKCGHWQALSRESILQRKGALSLIQRLEAHDDTATFPADTFHIGCVKCYKTLDRINDRQQWVTEKQEVKDISGYRMSGLDCAWVDGDKVMLSLRDMRPGLGPWMNYELGEPYLGDIGGIPENLVYALVNPELVVTCLDDLLRKYPQAIVAMGIDWGKTSYALPVAMVPGMDNIIILQPFSFTDTQDPSDAWKAMLEQAARWKAEAVVADEGYGQDRNPYLHAALGNRFFACRYDTHTGTDRPMFAPRMGAAGGRDMMGNALAMVSVGRAPSLKARIVALKNKKFSIAKISDGERWYDLLDLHFRNVAVVANELADRSLIETAETTGPDHFLHALNYAVIALEWAVGRRVSVREVDAPQSIMAMSGGDTGIPAFEEIEDVCDILGV